MEGKVVVITGAKGGLGNTVTETFLNAGATVVGVSRSIKQSDFPHPRFIALSGELSNGDAARSLAEQVVQRCGRLDALVHLVGGFAAKSVAETDDTTWERMFDINAKSAFYMTKAVIPAMRAAGGGRIIAIGTRAALEPTANLGAYAASKAALIALIRTLALENKDAGITANAVVPVTIDTPANRAADPKADPSRWISPRTLAGLILWLAGPEGGQVSGAVIPVYGRDV